jgi:hypothetical protein
MRRCYFISYSHEKGFGYTHITVDERISNNNLNKIESHIEKNIGKKICVLFYKRVFFYKKGEK